jgi:hypothetical protein
MIDSIWNRPTILPTPCHRIPSKTVSNSPRLSIIVIAYRMPRQALNTLYSLSTRYQQAIAAADYEVILVENESPEQCDPTAVSALGENIRYFSRREEGVSPVPALRFGIEQARGKYLGLVLDGAQMLTPRALEYVLMATRMADDPVIAVPGYHLGEADHKHHLSSSHNEAVEIEKLAALDWKQNGYRLFQFACFSSGNKAGYLQPMLESSALFCRRDAYQEFGGAHPGFDQPGGGSINLYLYRKLLMREQARLFVLAGEGSFHQFHGGVTTSEDDEREALLKSFDERLEKLSGEAFRATAREPQILGAVSHFAQPFLQQSLQRAMRRFAIHAKQERNFWSDERFDYWTEAVTSADSDLRSATPVVWESVDE